MRVLNNKFVRVSLIVCLILSLTLSSAFAASVSVPYAEPPTGSNDGYISIEFSGGTTVTTWWHAQTSISASTNVAPYVSVNYTGSKVEFSMYATPLSASYNLDYQISRRTQSYVWLMGSGQTSSSVTYSFSTSSLGTPVNITYGGLISNLSGFDSRVGSLNLLFEATQNIYADVDGIYNTLNSLLALTQSMDSTLNSKLQTAIGHLSDISFDVDELRESNEAWFKKLFDELGLSNEKLDDIIDILLEFKNTTLDESTDPLPNQGLVDFESSQGSLRNDSDVSNNLDSVFNDADFGSFSNGFNVIWSLVDSVLNTNPIFFSLVILVLTLGLLNLIFNRR